MYEYLNGELAHILPTAIVVDVHGVGYQVVFANPYRLQDSLKKQIKVLVQQVVREDSITLYGFISSEERELFQRLISVSGIGPKSAMSILANDDTEGFVNAVESGNVTYLTKFPGVGKKTAQKMVLALKGQLTGLHDTERAETAQKSEFEDMVYASYSEQYQVFFALALACFVLSTVILERKNPWISVERLYKSVRRL